MLNVIPPPLLLLSLTTWLYAKGGRRHKAWRRFGAGLLLPAGTMWLAWQHGAFHPSMLFALLSYPVALSTGYGAEQFGMKLLHRALYGFLLGLAGLPLLSLHPTLLIFQIALAVGASLILGVLNPTNAVSEEALIWLLGTACVPLGIGP